jgi:hypothetical protein
MDSLRLSQLHDGAVPLEGVLDAGVFRTQAEMLRLIESSPHDQCIDAAAVARRSGAHLCLIVEPCAQSGAKSVGGSLGGKGLTFVAGSVAEPDFCHPTMRGDGRSAQTAAIPELLLGGSPAVPCLFAHAAQNEPGRHNPVISDTTRFAGFLALGLTNLGSSTRCQLGLVV